MKITKNAPAPVPPPTYTIEDLTHEELVLLRDALGKFDTASAVHSIYESLYPRLKQHASMPVKYRLVDREHGEIHNLIVNLIVSEL